MTCIIILEENVELPGVHDATERLINYHVSATGARYQDQLEARIAEGRPARLADLGEEWPLSEYQNIVMELNAIHPLWSVRDDRLVLFLEEFAGIAGDVRLLWVDSRNSRTGYEKALHALNHQAFDSFAGPKLRTKTGDDWEGLINDHSLGA